MFMGNIWPILISSFVIIGLLSIFIPLIVSDYRTGNYDASNGIIIAFIIIAVVGLFFFGVICNTVPTGKTIEEVLIPKEVQHTSTLTIVISPDDGGMIISDKVEFYNACTNSIRIKKTIPHNAYGCELNITKSLFVSNEIVRLEK